jgi:hypothetical protein
MNIRKIKKWLIDKLLGVPKGAVWGRVQIDEWSYRLNNIEDIRRVVHLECLGMEADMMDEIKRRRK